MAGTLNDGIPGVIFVEPCADPGTGVPCSPLEPGTTLTIGVMSELCSVNVSILFSGIIYYLTFKYLHKHLSEYKNSDLRHGYGMLLHL